MKINHRQGVKIQPARGGQFSTGVDNFVSGCDLDIDGIVPYPGGL